MTSTEREYAERRMQQRWHDLVIAEQRGAAVTVLERLFNAYMLAVEEFNRSSSLPTEKHTQPEQVKKVQPGRAGKKKAS